MSDFMSEMVFDSPKPLEVPVKLGGESFILKGASAGAAQDYNAMMMRCVRVDKGVLGVDGKPDMTKVDLANLSAFTNVETMMLSRCLFRRKDGTDAPVSEEFVAALDPGVVNEMYNRVQLLSPSLFPDAAAKDLLKNG